MTRLTTTRYAVRLGQQWHGGKRFDYAAGTYDNITGDPKAARLFTRRSDAETAAVRWKGSKVEDIEVIFPC